MGYNAISFYELTSTTAFDVWLKQLDSAIRIKVLARLDRLQFGNLGDHKVIAPNLYELRCFFAGGLRMYFTIRHAKVILLIAGGNKSSQSKDIKAANALLAKMEK